MHKVVDREDPLVWEQYCQMLQEIVGIPVSEVDVKRLVTNADGYQSLAVDTRDTCGAALTTTLKYKCDQWSCCAALRIRIVRGIIDSVEHVGEHNHGVPYTHKKQKQCSICHFPGHNKVGCPFVEAYGEISELVQNPTPEKVTEFFRGLAMMGWGLLFAQSLYNQIIRLIDVTDVEEVRRYFRYAPNTNEGIASKMELYRLIMGSSYSTLDDDLISIVNTPIEPNIDIAAGSYILGYEKPASMIYALLWRIYYVALNEIGGGALLARMKSDLSRYSDMLEMNLSGPESQILRSAVITSISDLDFGLAFFGQVDGRTIILDGSQLCETENTLLLTFMSTVEVRNAAVIPHKFLKGCWTVQHIRMPNGTANIDRLDHLKQAIIHLMT